MRVLLSVLLACACSLLTATVNAQTLSGDYTIDPGKPDGDRNFSSYEKATLALDKGITGPVVFTIPTSFSVFNGQVSVFPVPGASATNTITFKGNGTEIRFLSTDIAFCAGIKLDGAKHYIFENFKVTSELQSELNYATGFQLLRDADSNIIRNCTIEIKETVFTNQQSWGIVIVAGDSPMENGVSYCDGNIITGNTISGGDKAIWVCNWMGNLPENYPNTVNNTQIINNKITKFWNYGIHLQQAKGSLVQGNDISTVSTNNTLRAIAVTQYSVGNRVIGNTVHDLLSSSSSSVQVSAYYVEENLTAVAGMENMFANNIAYMPAADKGQYHGLYINYNVRGVNAYHNTFHFNSTGATEARAIYIDLSLGQTPAEIRFYNNIVSITGIFNNAYGVYVASATVGTYFNRNDYYLATTGTMRVGHSPSNYTSLASWQTATGQDLTSVSMDPAFEDLSKGLLKPREQKLDNRASYVGIDKDYANVSRSNTFPDMGAYEFLSIPCSSPVKAGTVVIAPGTTLCEGATVSMDLADNSAGDKQTYQWQYSTTADGTFTNVGSLQEGPGIEIATTTSLFYRAQVTCGTETAYSTPVQLTVNPRIVPGEYTINAAVATGGTNFKSFADAIQSLACGVKGPVVFNVVAGSGPYNEQVVMNPVIGASETNTVTFNGNGETLRFLATVSAQRAVVKLNGARFITFNNLRIQADGTTSSQFGVGVHMLLGASRNTISNCTIVVDKVQTSNNYIPVLINGNASSATSYLDSYCDSNLLYKNTIIGGDYGILVRSLITNVGDGRLGNRFEYNKIQDAHEYGIHLAGNVNATIIGNEFSRPTRTVTGTYYALYMAGNNYGLQVAKNKFFNLFGGMSTNATTSYCIYSGSADALADKPNIIANNLVYNYNGRGDQYALYNSNSDYTYYYHNTILMDDKTLTANKSTYGFYQTSTATGIDFKNNIIVISRSGTGTSYGMYMNTATTTYTSDYNNLYIRNGTYYTGRFNGQNYKLIGDWRGVNGQEAESLGMDPVFVSVSGGDLTPTVGGLNDQGIYVNIPRDIMDTKRIVAHPDMGAYEFGCASYPTVAVQDNAVDVCVDATATLKVDAPSSAVTYTWYNGKEDDATALATAEEYTTTAITAPAKYYVEAADAVTGCSNWDRIEVAVAPIAKPTVAVIKDELWACSGNTVTFEVKDASSAVTYKWFNAASGGTEVHQGNTYTTPAVTVASDFSVQAYSAEGCTNDIRVPVKTISIAYPAIAVVTNSQQVCLGEEATFSVKTPETGIIYTWYDAATAGTTKGTGTSYTAQAASANQEYWVGAATTEGCTTGIREHVVLTGLQKLTVVPDVTADSLAADLVRFKWAAVPGATSYDVSTDGVNFVTPSSGSTGLTHTISGLSPLQTVSLYVRARAVIECQDIISLKTELRSLTGTFFVPNMFSPNGDGKNEVFQLYGNTIQSSKMMIYNQWGEKIFETQDAKQGWNGLVKGTQSSVGVYIYVISIVFRDGTTQNLKGTLNLIR